MKSARAITTTRACVVQASPACASQLPPAPAPPCAIVAFASNGTKNPNAFVVINTSVERQTLGVAIVGGGAHYHINRATETKQYAHLGGVEVMDGKIERICPAESVTSRVEE